MTEPRDDGWLRTPLVVELPAVGRTGPVREVTVPDALWRAPARLLTITIPIAMAVVGLSVAVVGALAEADGEREALGAFGVEAGSALWFAGAVTLGARRGATVLRALTLVATALAGVVAVAMAFALDWEGAALTLAMELGVGAMAIAVVDVVLLGVIHRRLDRVASSGAVLRVAVGRSWHVLDVRVDRAPSSKREGDPEPTMGP